MQTFLIFLGISIVWHIIKNKWQANTKADEAKANYYHNLNKQLTQSQQQATSFQENSLHQQTIHVAQPEDTNWNAFREWYKR